MEGLVQLVGRPEPETCLERLEYRESLSLRA